VYPLKLKQFVTLRNKTDTCTSVRLYYRSPVLANLCTGQLLRVILNRSASRKFSTGEQFSRIFTGEQTKKYNNKKTAQIFPMNGRKSTLLIFLGKLAL
jgi:hypothetical protein